MSKSDTVIFDFGGVLIDWNPRHLYRKLMPGDEAAMEKFLASVCNSAWNEQQDRGRSLADGTAVLMAEHPDHAELIDVYYRRWEEMVGGAIAGTVEILEELHRRGVSLYALSNWSAETFPRVSARFPFLALFKGIVLSGEVGMAKPDPDIFHLLLERHRIDPASAVFVDDVLRNVIGAKAVGIDAILFTDPAALRRDLRKLGLL